MPVKVNYFATTPKKHPGWKDVLMRVSQ